MTEAGLNTVNLSMLNTFQQFILFLLIMLGSAIWVSIAVVHVRRRAFERRFTSIVEEKRQRDRLKRRDRSNSRSRLSFGRSFNRSGPEVDGSVVRGRVIKSDVNEGGATNGHLPGPIEMRELQIAENKSLAGIGARDMQESDSLDIEPSYTGPDPSQERAPLSIETGINRRITFASPTSPTRHRMHNKLFAMQGVGAAQNIQNHPMKTPRPIYPDDLPKLDGSDAEKPNRPIHSLLSGHLIGRNSQISGLSPAERDKLGGAEYRAVTILSVVVPLYFFLWQFLGCIGLGAYVAYNRSDATKVNSENPW